jgi:hypothetical protein
MSGAPFNVELGANMPQLHQPQMDLSPAVHQCDTAKPMSQPLPDHISPAFNGFPSPDDQIKLVELYFSHVQVWLPLLHRPRFYAHYLPPSQAQAQLVPLCSLPLEEQFLLMGVFALAARHMDPGPDVHSSPPERGDTFFIEAQRCYETLGQSQAPPSIILLQGCILLAFYCFTSGPMTLTWGPVSRCVDLAYELDLNSIDDDSDDLSELDPEEWTTREEFRRAWWLVWELDTFNAVTSRRPCKINKKRVTTHLPCSDEMWYAGTPVASAKLVPEPKDAWKSLENCANQDERAWYLVVNYTSSIAHDMAQLTGGVLPEQKRELELSLSCLRLALPPIFHLRSNPFAFDKTNFARGNWIVAVHLILAGTKLTISTVVEEGSPCHNEQAASSSASASKARFDDITWIVGNWPPDFIAVAHPFIACTMMPVYVPSSSTSQTNPASLTHDLARLVLGHYSRVWRIGSTLQMVGNMRERAEHLSEDEFVLARRFAVAFPRKITKRTYKEHRGICSPKNSTGPLSSTELPPPNVARRQNLQQESDGRRENLQRLDTGITELDLFGLSSSVSDREWQIELDFPSPPLDALLGDPVGLPYQPAMVSESNTRSLG